MLGDIDLTLKPEEVDIFLCLPNRTTIAKLTEAYDIRHKYIMGNINELEFTIPPFIDKNNVITDNSNITKIKERYNIKVVKGLDIEYYLVCNIKSSAEDEDTKIIQCKSLGYELRDKDIRVYSTSETPVNATTVLTDVLTNTIWNVGYIDADFDLKYRSYEFNGMKVLDAVFSIADKLNAIIVWDTVNREIDFYETTAIGTDKGLTITDKKYLKTLDMDSNTDEMCTRLTCFGQDDLTFASVNPAGVNYIEDYSYFLYPFTRDESGNVLTHSNYMSDGLCSALLDYSDLVEANSTTFATYLSTKEGYETQLVTLENAYTTLIEEMAVIQDNLDVANANGDSTTAIIAQKVAKQTEIDNKLLEIKSKITDIGAVNIPITIDTAVTNVNLTSGTITLTIDGYTIPLVVTNTDTTSTIASKIVNYINQYFASDLIGTITVTPNIIDVLYYTNNSCADVTVSFVDTSSTGVTITVGTKTNTGVQGQILTLKDTLAIENNFTSAQIIEWNPFILTETWSDDNYIDPQDLYDDALVYFENMNCPQLNINIDIVDFLRVVECQRDWDKLSLGDIVKVRYPRLNIDVETKIIEIEFNYDDYKIQLTLANTKKIKSDEEKLVDLLYKSVGTSASLDMSKYKWNNIDSVNSSVNDLYHSLTGQVKNEIALSLNNSVSVSRRGIIVTSLDDPLTMLIIQNGKLAVSSDGGNNWSNFIGTSGIVGERIIGQIIAGSNLTITTGNGDFTVNETGVVINGASLTITGGLDASQITGSGTWLEEGTAYNGVVIDSVNGLVVTKSDDSVRTLLNATDGIKIQTSLDGGVNWSTKFYADSSGDLTITGDMVGGTIEIGSGDDVFKADSNGIYLGDSTFGDAPFRVSMDGTLYAEDADISGNVNCTNLYLNGTNLIKTIEGEIQKIDIDQTSLNAETIYALGTGQIIEYVEVEWTAGDLYFYFTNTYTTKPVYVIQPSCNASVVQDANLNYIGVTIPASAHGGTVGTIFNLIAICRDIYDPLAEPEEPVE